MPIKKKRYLIAALAVGYSLLSSAWAERADKDHSIHQQEHSTTHEDHSMHKSVLEKRDFYVTRRDYAVPEVSLLDANSNEIALSELLALGEPLALNFIFTTCNTICPVMTATFAQMRRELNSEERSRLKIISISIDPEYDRPDVLKSYSELFEIDDTWTLLTGKSEDINRVLRSFDAFSGSKMNHQPVTLLRAVEGNTWIRVDGLTSGKELAEMVKEYVFE